MAKTGSETVMVMILGMLAILTGLILVIRRRSEA
ncbi:LPXTG cell wall anchor domain-containing protein [Corynebacterium pseudotuberculosis]|nr:LPXTG cell wall anchor domain-containing protein [Corynebacterium pseudotuberculosis]MEB3092121.1 LPXTG cell wall anchor domain-containing protein [Corynebacterium pseudotuberculosis]